MRTLCEEERLTKLLSYESALWQAGKTLVAGVDEAGCGPWAGPVMAAAVILPVQCRIPGIDDSKRLSHEKRLRLVPIIQENAIAYAVAACSVQEIDRLNIREASRWAMSRAVLSLAVQPEHVLVDARIIPNITMPQQGIVHGDAKSQSIAAASILAKVARDLWMLELAKQYPGYGFEQHKGYGTAMHQRALTELGCCPEHRRSFAPIARRLGQAVKVKQKAMARKRGALRETFDRSTPLNAHENDQSPQGMKHQCGNQQ